jgi:hypothetical protein
MLGAAALFGSEVKLEGGITPDGVDQTRALKAAIPYMEKGALHLRYEYDDSTAPNGRRVKFAGALLANSDVAFTSAHVIDGGLLDRNLKAWVSSCTNYNDTQGPWYEVKSFHMFPKYVDDSSREFTADIACLKLCTNVTTTTPVVMATEPVPNDEKVIYIGSGAAGTPSSGLLPRDGNVRAGESKTKADSLFGVSLDFYKETRFDNSPSNLDGLRPTPGYSGWPVYVKKTDKVECVGIATYGSLAVWGSTAGYLKWHPEVTAWMSLFTTPELKISQTPQGIELRWNADSTWRVQARESITGGPWRDLPTPSPSPSSGDRVLVIPPSELRDSDFFQIVQSGQ